MTLPTAIAQCLPSGVPGYLLRQALAVGRDRGALTAAEAGGTNEYSGASTDPRSSLDSCEVGASGRRGPR